MERYHITIKCSDHDTVVLTGVLSLSSPSAHIFLMNAEAAAAFHVEPNLRDTP